MSTPIATFKDLCVDAVDPLLLGRFWADALRLELVQDSRGMVLLKNGEQTLPLRVPERDAKSVVTFTSVTSPRLGDAFQGLGVSMPMTWTFQQ